MPNKYDGDPATSSMQISPPNSVSDIPRRRSSEHTSGSYSSSSGDGASGRKRSTSVVTVVGFPEAIFPFISCSTCCDVTAQLVYTALGPMLLFDIENSGPGMDREGVVGNQCQRDSEETATGAGRRGIRGGREGRREKGEGRHRLDSKEGDEKEILRLGRTQW